MDTLPEGSHLFLGLMPFLGIGLLAVVLAALAGNKDKLIAPGVVLVFFAVTGWGTAMEYGGAIKEMVAPAPEVADNDDVGDLAYNGGDYYEDDAYYDEDYEADDSDAGDEERDDDSGSGDKSRLIPIKNDSIKSDRDRRSRGPRREVRVNPKSRNNNRRPADTRNRDSRSNTRDTRPSGSNNDSRDTRSSGRSDRTPPPAATPPSSGRPSTTVARNDRLSDSAGTGRDEPSRPSGGTGNLVIKINGTLVENSDEPSRSPHLLVILDGREVEIKRPSQIKESHLDNDPSKPLQAVTYTWSNQTIRFNNLKPGFHIVMIDTSLGSPAQHQADMLGGRKSENDYNGTVEIKAGETATMEFGGKNFMSGKLKRIR